MLEIILPFFALFAVWLILELWRRRSKGSLPSNTVLVDGSNVMHWGGEPRSQAVADVSRSLEQMGYLPVVFFDANVGYKLEGRHLSETSLSCRIGLPREQVIVVRSGTQADGHLLEQAARYDLQIVTNDRFRDWADKYPAVKEHGFLIKGAWVAGEVRWRFPQDFRPV